MTTEASTLWSETIGHLQLKPALTVSITDSIETCLNQMRSSNDPFLIVLDQDEHISGVYNERDILNSYLGTNLSKATEVGAVMSHDIHTFDASLSVREAMNFMGEHKLSQLPVIEKEKIIGILTVESLLDYLSECFPEELIKQPPRKN